MFSYREGDMKCTLIPCHVEAWFVSINNEPVHDIQHVKGQRSLPDRYEIVEESLPPTHVNNDFKSATLIVCVSAFAFLSIVSWR